MTLPARRIPEVFGGRGQTASRTLVALKCQVSVPVFAGRAAPLVSSSSVTMLTGIADVLACLRRAIWVAVSTSRGLASAPVPATM